MTDKSILANQLITLFRDRTSTVDDLLDAFEDKEPRADLSAEVSDQVIGYAQKAYALLLTKPLDPATSIRSLVLDDDGFIEADVNERRLHSNINFAIIYAEL